MRKIADWRRRFHRMIFVEPTRILRLPEMRRWSRFSSLGHASIVTTERYLGTRQNLRRGPGDYIQLLQFAPKIRDGYVKATGMVELRQTSQDHSQQEFGIEFQPET
jgi:hypothetical protein